jgi:hypothetical protein
MLGEPCPPGWNAWLRGCGVLLGRCMRAGSQGMPLAGGQHEAAAEQIELRPAKHVALQHFEAVDVPLDRAIGPGQGDAALPAA